MARGYERSKRRRNSPSTSTLPPIPPCEGPKLDAFPDYASEIDWLERLDDPQQPSPKGGEGYVYKVKINSHLYALKVFKHFNPEDSRFSWGPILDETIYSTQTVAYHIDPFFAECRAYGRIKEARVARRLKRQPEIPCLGYLLLRGKDREKLRRDGIDLDEACLDENEREPWESDPVEIPRPVRAIVKQLASNESGVKKSALRGILADIKALNKLEIYNTDIREENYRDGKLIDFGSAWTEPHCYLHSDDQFEASETRLGDLAGFDDMVASSGIETKLKGLPPEPNSSYKAKLRSTTKDKNYKFVSL